MMNEYIFMREREKRERRNYKTQPTSVCAPASLGLPQAFGMKTEDDSDYSWRAAYSSFPGEPFRQSYSVDKDGAINLCDDEEEEEEEGEEDKKIDVNEPSIACTSVGFWSLVV